MQRLDFGAKGQHLQIVIDNDGPIDRCELSNQRQGADQPFVNIVSLPGEKMVVDGVQLRITLRISKSRWPSSSEELLVFFLRTIRVIGDKFQHLPLHADRIEWRRSRVDEGFLDRYSPGVIVWHNNECPPRSMRIHFCQDILNIPSDIGPP